MGQISIEKNVGGINTVYEFLSLNKTVTFIAKREQTLNEQDTLTALIKPLNKKYKKFSKGKIQF